MGKVQRCIGKFKAILMLLIFVGLFLPLKVAGADSALFNHKHQKQYLVRVPSMNAVEAFRQLSEQTSTEFLFPYDLAESRTTQAVVGRHTVLDALDIMLRNTGLASGLSEKGAITIFLSDGSHDSLEGRGSMNSKKNLLAATVAFFVGGGGSVVLAQEGAGKDDSGFVLEEIVVTASKRSESLQDAAMAVSAVTGEIIDKRGLVGMDDYLRNLPGVDMQDRGAGQNSVIIRGLGADPQIEKVTVGVYFGETPISGLGGSGAQGQGGSPDLKLVDIERIEVLRGPQGTLYGSGSMGGAVRIIPMGPNLTEVEGRLATRYSHTGEQGGDNTMVQAVLNLPLIQDKLAVRGVAYRFDNSGYINNVAASKTPSGGFADAVAATGVARDHGDSGSDEYTGFRLATLWQPIDALDITLAYTHQEIEQDGQPEVNLNLSGGYQQTRLGVGVGGADRESLANDIDITNLVINYDMGWGLMTSSSSWVDYRSTNDSDMVEPISAFFSFYPAGFPMGTAAPYYNHGENDHSNFSQEIRLSSQLDGRFQFVGGIYYEDNENDLRQTWSWSGDPSEDPNPGLNLFDVPGFESTEQKAVFGEVSYEITNAITATLGGRYFDYDRENRSGFGVFIDRATLGAPQAVSETDSSYKANLSYTPTDDILIYTQWAEGFRLGRGMGDLSSLCDPDGNGVVDELGIPLPTQIDSDTSESFELGIKTSLADKRVTLNAAAYSIDWDGIPVATTTRPGCSLILNAGKANSEGVELELQAAITESLQVDVSASYGEAVLEETSSLGNKGDNLPGSADFNFSLGMEYGFDFVQHPAFVRIDYSYISEYYSNTTETGDASGGFGKLDLKVGMTFNQFDIDIFVNNATNADEYTWVESLWAGPYDARRAYQIRPRTIGFNLGYRF